MSKITTNVQMNRFLTEEEKSARDAYLKEQYEAGLLDMSGEIDFQNQRIKGIRTWTTEDAANAYIVWANSNFNPAPISAKIEIV